MSSTEGQGPSATLTEQDYAQKFGAWLNDQMAQQNMTQADLARRVNLSRGQIHHYRQGTHRPRPHTMRRIAEGLGVDLGDALAIAGYTPEGSSDHDELAAMVRYIPNERLPEARRFIQFLINSPDRD